MLKTNLTVIKVLSKNFLCPPCELLVLVLQLFKCINKVNLMLTYYFTLG